MKKIIIALVLSLMTISNGFAMSIVEAIQTPNAKGITQCIDNTAQNFREMAPCLYIREAAPRVMVANNYNNNDRLIGKVNPFGSNTSENLVDTSSWYHTTQVTHYNNQDTSNYSAQDRLARGVTQCLDSAANNYKAMAPCLYIREAAPRVLTKYSFADRYIGRTNPFYNNGEDLIDTSVWYRTPYTAITDTSTSTNFVSGATTLPAWFGSSFNSVQTFGDISLYGNNDQYLAINHNTKQPLFQTTSGQTIQYIYTGSESTIFVMGSQNPSKPNLSNNGINSNTIYIATNAGVVVANDMHTVIPVAANNSANPWGQDIIIAASFVDNNNLTWNYVVLNHLGQVLKSGTSTNNVNYLTSLVLTSNTPSVIAPVTPAYYAPAVVKPVAKDLTFKINYDLGTQNTDGSYKLNSATCNTNGTVDLLWIEKIITDNYYGVGIEINNTFGNQTYKINKGDRLCCRVSMSVGTYEKAGGCMIVE